MISRPALHRSLAAAIALCTTVVAQAAPGGEMPSYAITDRIRGADAGWDFANIDPSLDRLFVARTDAVMAIDLASGKVTARLAPAHGAHQVLVLPRGEILETDGATDLARFVDGHTGALKAEVKTGSKPDAALYDPSSKLVVIMAM